MDDILKLIKKKKLYTVKDLKIESGKSRQWVHYVLSKLARDGILEKSGTLKRVNYKLKK